ncbi:MAG TPA: DUF1259 domain-containing protein [Gammaproteobacteria bacterium]|nr:DUF1259 domain-containing protein [Gammaproteobacteria bacterium]
MHTHRLSLSAMTAFAAALLLVTSVTVHAAGAALDAKAIGAAAGVKASDEAGGVVKITWSRDDVKVKVDGMELPPAAGLGSWAAFTATTGKDAMVMGDTVVFQDEVDAAMDAAFSHGLEVTALHNHFFYDQPRVFFMHIGGEGDPVTLAQGVKAVWDAIKAVRKAHATPVEGFPGGTPKKGSLDSKSLSAALGNPLTDIKGVLKMTVAKHGKMHGAALGGPMGLTTWAAFTGDDKLAAMDGDFIMTAEEVQPVLHALRHAGIHVVALHNHMTESDPPYFFLHFWGKGAAADLAKGLRSALDAQAEVGH